MPQATPRSVATTVTVAVASTRCTLPSNRLDTCSAPSGSNASDVGFARSDTNGSREPSGRTMKIGDRPLLPARSAEGDVEVAGRVERRAVDLVKAGRERGADVDERRFPGALLDAHRRMAAVEPGRHDRGQLGRGRAREPRRQCRR